MWKQWLLISSGNIIRRAFQIALVVTWCKSNETLAEYNYSQFDVQIMEPNSIGPTASLGVIKRKHLWMTVLSFGTKLLCSKFNCTLDFGRNEAFHICYGSFNAPNDGATLGEFHIFPSYYFRPWE